MADMYHVVLKDYENAGYIWDEFFCSECLKCSVTKSEHLEILKQVVATPKYLSRIYPPLVNEPHCCKCGRMFTH